MSRGRVLSEMAPVSTLKSDPNPGVDGLRIICAIPCLNTERCISGIVSQVKKSVPDVIVIDDGSIDRTAIEAEMAGALVISHSVNRGPGAATRSCFEEARRRDSHILVTLDGDGQHNPDEIMQILEPIRDGEADIVIGSRFLKCNGTMPRYRKLGIKLITLLYNLGANTKLTDAQACFRAYGKRALDSLAITDDGFGFSVEVLVQARRKHLNIKEVPISCAYQGDCHSLNPLLHGMTVAFAVLRFRFRDILTAKRIPIGLLRKSRSGDSHVTATIQSRG